MAVDLKEFADLRNAIVHDRGGGYRIADPHDATVSRIESILALISRPPRLDALFSGPVAAASSEQQLGVAAQVMRSGDYSQLPVYDPEGRFVGLLTAETIARWVAAKLSGRRERLRASLWRPVSRDAPVSVSRGGGPRRR